MTRLRSIALDPQRHMKPMLSMAIKEAVKLALIDSCDALELVRGGEVRIGHRFHVMLPARRGPVWTEFSASMRELGEKGPWAEDWDGGPANANGVVSEIGNDCWLTLDGFAALEFQVEPDEQYLVRRDLTEVERGEMDHDTYSWPTQFVDFDPGALAQNVAVRLLGPGEWMVSGVYAGNASTQDVVDASVARPHHRDVDDIAFDLKLRPADGDDSGDRS